MPSAARPNPYWGGGKCGSRQASSWYSPLWVLARAGIARLPTRQLWAVLTTLQREHAHNLFLQIGLDTGLIGMMVFIALFVVALLVVWRGNTRANDPRTGNRACGCARGHCCTWDVGCGVLGGARRSFDVDCAGGCRRLRRARTPQRRARSLNFDCPCHYAIMLDAFHLALDQRDVNPRSA